MIFDKEKGIFIDYSEHFPAPYSGIIMWKNDLTRNQPNLEVIVLVSSYWKNYCGETLVPTNFHQHKLNQLKLLGYKYVDVSYKGAMFAWVAPFVNILLTRLLRTFRYATTNGLTSMKNKNANMSSIESATY